MGKRLKFLVVLFTLSLFVLTVSADEADTASIEQVYVNLPQVTVYGRNLTLENTADQETYLGGAKLTPAGNQNFSESDEGVIYYLLLDISNSVPPDYFERIKNGILQFESALGQKDHLVLYTFGESVNLVLDENHNSADSGEVLSKIKNTDRKTLLFEAISRAADDSQKSQDINCKRKIIMVISDGEDFATGKTMSEEALENLGKKGIPAYAFGIETASRDNLNSFGEFSRRSGGELSIFNKNQASQVLLDFHNKVMNSQVLRFNASSNRVSNKMETFSMNIISMKLTLSKEVMTSHWIKDTQAPQVINLKKTDDRQIQMEFTEPVIGSEVPASYTVRSGEKVIPVSGVSRGTDSQSGTAVVTITVGEDLKPGDYEISCPGIKDDSMEENLVSNTGTLTVEQLPLGKRILDILKTWYWILIVAIAAILITVAAVIYRKVKKARGVLYMDDKMILASNVEVHQHVSIKEKNGKEFQMVIHVSGSRPETLKLTIADSFIVGRSKISNLYFDDARMSKQHFVLEWDGDNMFVTDLDTTNGTLVNGLRINVKRRLEQKDIITAGTTEMTIGW